MIVELFLMILRRSEIVVVCEVRLLVREIVLERIV